MTRQTRGCTGLAALGNPLNFRVHTGVHRIKSQLPRNWRSQGVQPSLILLPKIFLLAKLTHSSRKMQTLLYVQS